VQRRFRDDRPDALWFTDITSTAPPKGGCTAPRCVIESLFGSMQIELLDRRLWATRTELANAIFEYIEAFYNPTGDTLPWATCRPGLPVARGYLSPGATCPRSTTKPFTPPQNRA
jgi:hypothetical protein